MESLYGLSFDDPRLLILMRHRAVLLGIIGGLLACAAFYPRLRRVAVVAGLLSMLSFILVVGLVGDPGPRIFRVAAIDAGASLALLVAWLIDRGRMERSGG